LAKEEMVENEGEEGRRIKTMEEEIDINILV